MKTICLSFCLIVSGLFFCLLPFQARAYIVTDGTVGPAQSLTGPDYTIAHDLGATAGHNLFHSFLTFSISQGQSATFTGPDTIQNVISRVTGGEESNIDGLLRSEMGNADFFFINPAGIVFGPNAQVDVPASFHASTASEIRFADERAFSASDPESSTLNVTSPESFGFLAPRPASISVNGSVLEFEPGGAFAFAAKDVTVSQGASLGAEGGTARLVAVG